MSSLSCIRINRPCGITSVYSSSSKNTFDILTQISTIHDELCDACALTEEYFTTQMLTTVIIAFLIIVFNTYYILGILFGNEPTGHHFSTAEFVTFFSYQILMHFFAVVAIVYVSSAATRESDKTAICVHKLLNVVKDEDLKAKLTQMSLQLIHRKVKFTACGLFPLDRTLIFTIVGATTTYLIILVQFTFNERDKVEIIKKNFQKIFKQSYANRTLNFGV